MSILEETIPDDDSNVCPDCGEEWDFCICDDDYLPDDDGDIEDYEV
jgi:hypothetical protein